MLLMKVYITFFVLHNFKDIVSNLFVLYNFKELKLLIIQPYTFLIVMRLAAIRIW